jgi:hypothetical protein
MDFMRTDVATTDTRNSILEGQTLEQLIEKAVNAVAKGENVDQVLEVMLASLPAAFKEKARKSFIAALGKRGLKAPTGEADIPSRATLNRIREMLAITTRQMLDRIMQLMRSRPDIAAAIQQAGRALTQSGVKDDKVTVPEGDLGTIAPGTTVSKPQDRGAGRGT